MFGDSDDEEEAGYVVQNEIEEDTNVSHSKLYLVSKLYSLLFNIHDSFAWLVG